MWSVFFTGASTMNRGTENLPELSHDEFSKIVTYFPFASLPELRLVSRTWNSIVIPNAAVLKSLTESEPWRETMIFACGDGTRSPCFVPVCFQKIGPHGATRQWGSSSMNPITSPCVSKVRRMHPSLFASEGGLLFFKFTSYKHRRGIINTQSSPGEGPITDEFLVCNPLTGRHKFLTLRRPTEKSDLYRLVGVAVSDAKHGYKLVVGRFYLSRKVFTISIYDSLTSSWKQDIRHAGFLAGDEQWSCQGERSVSHNGSLYWLVQTRSREKDGSMLMESSNVHEIITYDVENEILSKFRAPGPAAQDVSQIGQDTSYLNELFAENPFSHIVSGDEELLTAFHSFLTSRCFTPSGLGTKKTLIKMPPEILNKLQQVPRPVAFHYSCFKQKETVYHIVLTLLGDLKIVIHDTAQSSIVEVNLDHYFFPERHFWAFSPSWAALP